MRGHRLATAWAITGGVIAVIVVLAAVLWFTVLPPALANLSAEVVDVDTPASLPLPDGPVTVTIPAGWVVQRPLFHDDTLVLRSPDRALELTVTAREDSPGAVFSDAASTVDGLGTLQSEVLGSGLTAIHAETDAVVVAAVGSPEGAVTAEVIARMPEGDPLADYLPAVAEVLAGIQVGS